VQRVPGVLRVLGAAVSGKLETGSWQLTTGS
jgi:hypothetical protein